MTYMKNMHLTKNIMCTKTKLHFGNYKLFYRVIFLVLLGKSVIFTYHTENVNMHTEDNNSLTKVL